MSTSVKPYGDTMNDGKVQLSFTLPVEWSEAADEAARQLVAKMGFEDVQVAEGRRIASGFSFFVVYASTPQAIDFSTIKAPSAKTHAMSMEEVDAFVNVGARPARHADDAIPLTEKQLGQKRTVLAGYAGDERGLHERESAGRSAKRSAMNDATSLGSVPRPKPAS